MKEITPEELKDILEKHKKWVESDGKEGERANFQETNLEWKNLQGVNLGGKDFDKADDRKNLEGASFQMAKLEGTNLNEAILYKAALQGANLYKAKLQRAELGKANLGGADLQEADLQNANLAQADLRGTNLKSTILREADLQDADLRGVKGLSVKQLAGAKMSGIKLSEAIGDINDLERVAEASKNARKIFQVMLLACLYAIITIATTNDVNLLTNSASSPLPIIGAAIPIVGFYFAAPILLLGCFIYFHLYLERLWEELSYKPAIFPDGKRLDERVYPWLLNDFVSSQFKHLKDNSIHLANLQKVISIILAWWIVPITLVFFWFRYLTTHDWWVTTLHIILLLLSIWAGLRFYLLAGATFRGEKRSNWRKAWKKMKTYTHLLVVLVFGTIFFSLSNMAINAIYPKSLDILSYWTTADFVEADVSTKPEKWTGEEIKLVKGARLKDANLQQANAYRAFLVNANLMRANLEGAKLFNANLQKAKLWGVNLQGASLELAELEGTTLVSVNLQEAALNSANLKDATLISVNLQKADLRGANLQGTKFQEIIFQGTKLHTFIIPGEADITKLQKTNLQGANLQGAHLEGADLTGALGLTKEQIESAHIDDKTKLPRYLQKYFRKQE